MNNSMISVGSVQKFWFMVNKSNGSFSYEENGKFEYEHEVMVLQKNKTDETELELRFSDGTVAWAQEINTY